MTKQQKKIRHKSENMKDNKIEVTKDSAPALLVSSLVWIVVVYVLVLSGFLFDVIASMNTDFVNENSQIFIRLLLLPGAAGMAFGNALLAADGGISFWLRFIVGLVVIWAIAFWLIFPIGFLFAFQ